MIADRERVFVYMQARQDIPSVASAAAEDLKALEAACRDYACGWYTASASRFTSRPLYPAPNAAQIRKIIMFEIPQMNSSFMMN